MSHQVTIRYCTKCKWLLRSAWMGQELLSTFENELDALTLIPGDGAVFEITVGDTLVWSRTRDGGFPEITELKRRVRDLVAPGRDLGHVDKAGADP